MRQQPTSKQIGYTILRLLAALLPNSIYVAFFRGALHVRPGSVPTYSLTLDRREEIFSRRFGERCDSHWLHRVSVVFGKHPSPLSYARKLKASETWEQGALCNLEFAPCCSERAPDFS